MTELQDKLLEMLTWLDKFLRDNRLTYYAVAGTLIGAARHHGFIPWDDDIDIAMPRPDYEKLCSLLEKPVDHYVIESPSSEAPDFLYTFAKFYDINTSMTEHLKQDVKRGVYIDIFPLDGLGDTRKQAIQNYKKIDRLNMLLMTRVCAYRKDRKWYKNMAIKCANLIPNKLFSEKNLSRKIDELNQKVSYDSSDYISLTMSTYRIKDIHEKRLLGEPREIQFENLSIFVPEYYDEYLTDTYGDWRKLPPEEKRHSAHDFIYLELNKAYMDIPFNQSSFPGKSEQLNPKK